MRGFILLAILIPIFRYAISYCYNHRTWNIKKFFVILSLMLFSTQYYVAQNLPPSSLPSGWERIYNKNVGNFDLPPTMEVQKGNYKEFEDVIKKIQGFDASSLTAQQKGLNEFSNEGYEKYARVMIQTTFGLPGDFLKLKFDTSELSQVDKYDMSSIYKQQIQQGFLGTGLKLIEWYPLKIEKINGMSCIHISYKRQLGDKPFVLVHMYSFHNNDRMHIFTLSYRLAEADYWKSDYEKILKSFRITNVR